MKLLFVTRLEPAAHAVRAIIAARPVHPVRAEVPSRSIVAEVEQAR